MSLRQRDHALYGDYNSSLQNAIQAFSFSNCPAQKEGCISHTFFLRMPWTRDNRGPQVAGFVPGPGSAHRFGFLQHYGRSRIAGSTRNHLTSKLHRGSQIHAFMPGRQATLSFRIRGTGKSRRLVLWKRAA
jgi:hypothetical protein